MKTVSETDSWPATKSAFELLALTASRSGEIRLADWSEVDLEKAV